MRVPSWSICFLKAVNLSRSNVKLSMASVRTGDSRVLLNHETQSGYLRALIMLLPPGMNQQTDMARTCNDKHCRNTAAARNP
jgi:hypothetical protein